MDFLLSAKFWTCPLIFTHPLYLPDEESAMLCIDFLLMMGDGCFMLVGPSK